MVSKRSCHILNTEWVTPLSSILLAISFNNQVYMHRKYSKGTIWTSAFFSLFAFTAIFKFLISLSASKIRIISIPFATDFKQSDSTSSAYWLYQDIPSSKEHLKLVTGSVWLTGKSPDLRSKNLSEASNSSTTFYSSVSDFIHLIYYRKHLFVVILVATKTDNTSRSLRSQLSGLFL